MAMKSKSLSDPDPGTETSEILSTENNDSADGAITPFDASDLPDPNDIEGDGEQIVEVDMSEENEMQIPYIPSEQEYIFAKERGLRSISSNEVPDIPEFHER